MPPPTPAARTCIALCANVMVSACRAQRIPGAGSARQAAAGGSCPVTARGKHGPRLGSPTRCSRGVCVWEGGPGGRRGAEALATAGATAAARLSRPTRCSPIFTASPPLTRPPPHPHSLATLTGDAGERLSPHHSRAAMPKRRGAGGGAVPRPPKSSFVRGDVYEAEDSPLEEERLKGRFDVRAGAAARWAGAAAGGWECGGASGGARRPHACAGWAGRRGAAACARRASPPVVPTRLPTRCASCFCAGGGELRVRDAL